MFPVILTLAPAAAIALLVAWIAKIEERSTVLWAGIAAALFICVSAYLPDRLAMVASLVLCYGMMLAANFMDDK